MEYNPHLDSRALKELKRKPSVDTGQEERHQWSIYRYALAIEIRFVSCLNAQHPVSQNGFRILNN
jgi:hypothetical protein